jgi:hypothetical protein
VADSVSIDYNVWYSSINILQGSYDLQPTYQQNTVSHYWKKYHRKLPLGGLFHAEGRTVPGMEKDYCKPPWCQNKVSLEYNEKWLWKCQSNLLQKMHSAEDKIMI